MHPLILLVAPAIGAAAVAFVLTPLVARVAVRIGAVDMPGSRKIHDRPIPRLGGLAVITAIAAVWTVTAVLTEANVPRALVTGLALGMLPILAISVLDDVSPVKAGRKLAAHVCGAIAAVACGISLGPDVHLFDMSIHLGLFAAPLSVLWIVGVTNAFNIIDGLDGLSAGLALISSLSIAAVFGVVDQPVMAGASLVLAGALAGFLPYNVHPARLFLGDSGATAIGFCLAAFALKGGSTLSTGFAVLVPVFILGLPIADTLIAMLRRTVNRLETRTGGVFVPDRNHVHHRLLALGVDHGRAVLILYGAGLLFTTVAFVSMVLKGRDAAMLIVALLVAGFVGVHRLGYDEFAFIRRGTVLRVYETPVFNKSLFVVFADLTMVLIAAYVAAALKMDEWSPAAIGPAAADLAGTFAPLTALIFWKAGIYRGSWRVAGVNDLTHAVGATVAVTVVGMLIHPWISGRAQPLSVFMIFGLVILVMVTSSRASYVLLLNFQRRASNGGAPVFVYGAGSKGVATIRELFDNPEAGLRPVGFIDDDPGRKGHVVNGIPVLGGSLDLERLITEHGAKALLVAAAHVRPEALARATAVCQRTGASLFRVQMQLERLIEDQGQTGVRPGSDQGQTGVRPRVRVDSRYAGIATTTASQRLVWLHAERCRQCGSSNLHRSRVRNIVERFRKPRTPKRPYRCHDCGWRGWLEPLELGAPLHLQPLPESSPLDAFFEETIAASAPELAVRDTM